MPRKPRRQPPQPECPNCGEAFPAGRPACPHCGSDAATGWRPGDEVDYQSLDVPDTFDDEDYRRTIDDIEGAGRPQGGAGARRRGSPGWSSRQVRIFVVGAILLAALIVPALVALVRTWR